MDDTDITEPESIDNICVKDLQSPKGIRIKSIDDDGWDRDLIGKYFHYWYGCDKGGCLLNVILINNYPHPTAKAGFWGKVNYHNMITTGS